MERALPYRNLYVGMIQILKSVFEQDKYTDKQIEYTFKQNKAWGSRDRGFVAEMVYDMVRWKRVIDFASGGTLKKRNYWAFIEAWLIINDVELPNNLEEFGQLNRDKVESSYREASKIPAVWYSVSDEFYELGKEQLGEEKWHKELEEMNHPAETILRVNTLKATPEEVVRELEEDEIEIEPISGMPLAYRIIDKAYVFKTKAFQEGAFEIQDVNSQKVAPFLDVQPGERVADTCAGGGGKSLHMAALMENKGQIISMDIIEWKLKELKRRAKRNGAFNIQTKWIDSNKVIKRWAGSFDRLLIDAPCTGSGVIKRNPDAKWKIDKDFLERVKAQQAEILKNYPKMLKSGGTLVYATCSIFPSENQEQIKKFLNENPQFELIEEEVLLPSETQFDGFYMAKLKKNS